MLEEAAVEAGVVGDHHPARQTVKHVTENGAEGGGVAHITSSNPVDVRRSQVSLGAEQGAPDLRRLPISAQADDGELDDSVVAARVDAGRLAVDYGE
jgi:hypothetical protein